MAGQLVAIFAGVILPILMLVALGALVQRLWPMHIPTLSRLNIYLFVPAFLFVRVYESSLTLGQIRNIAAGTLLPMVMLGVPLYLLLRRAGAAGTTTAALVVGGLIYNAGNYGLPLAELLYQSQGVLFPGMAAAADGPAVQALVVMMSNLTVWGLGYVILALAQGQSWRQAMGYLRLPTIYVLVAAFFLRWLRQEYNAGADVMPTWLMYPVRQVSLGLIPVALVTLGAQLAQRARWPRWRLVGPVLVLKLALLPAVTAAVVWLLGMWPWPGAQLIIASAAPTAVNTLLLTLELEGDADLAADCVFWTTLASAVSVTAVLTIVISLGQG